MRTGNCWRAWGGGAGSYFAILVVNAAMAGAHEELGRCFPADGAAEVGALNRESLKGCVHLHGRSQAAVSESLPPPGDGGGVLEGDLGGLADLEFVERADASPDRRLLAPERCEQEAGQRKTYDSGSQARRAAMLTSMSMLRRVRREAGDSEPGRLEWESVVPFGFGCEGFSHGGVLRSI